MSHYTVGVILKKDEVQKTIDELRKVKTIEVKETYKETEFKAIQFLTEKALLPYWENARTLDENTTKKEIEEEYNTILNYTEEEIENDENKKKMHEMYKDETLEFFAKNHCGYEIEGDKLYMDYNPSGKWDWYVIGGRWNNSLPKKNNDNKKDNLIDGYVDDINSYAQIKDLVFRRIISSKQEQEYRENYNELISKGDFFKPEYYLRKYPNFEIFLKHKLTFSTYAVLDSNNKWHEPGQMGWFGCSSASPEEERDFNEVFLSIMNKEDEENYFVLVDCHI